MSRKKHNNRNAPRKATAKASSRTSGKNQAIPQEKRGEGLMADAPEIKTVTVRGIEMTMTDDQFNDYYFLDALEQVDSGTNPIKMAKAMRIICGSKHSEVMAVLEDDNGRVPIEEVGEFVAEFFKALGEKYPN